MNLSEKLAAADGGDRRAEEGRAGPRRRGARGRPATTAKERPRRRSTDRTSSSEEAWSQSKAVVQAKVLAEIAPTAADLSPDELRAKVRSTVNEILEHEDIGISPIERQRFVEEMLEDSLGYGPLEALLADKAPSPKSCATASTRSGSSAQGKIAAQQRRLQLAAPVPAHHRPDGARRGPARRRVLADGGRPAGRRLPYQRHRAAARAARSGAHHPEVPRASPWSCRT